MSENIVWSAESCSLKTFLHSYTLPQLVKVEQGFCSEDDAETLSTGEILMLHAHSVTKLFVEDADYRQYFVPRNCQCKVEILPRICQDTYHSVEDVIEAWTSADFKFIRVVEVRWHSPSLRIRAGDILELKRTVEQNHIKFLECVFYGTETGYLVKLPLDVNAVFEPLARKESYLFQEVIRSFEFPVRVKFKSNCKTKDTNNNQSRGSVLLTNIRRESKIIATSRDDDMNPVLMIPTDLDVCVFPAHGAILGDKEYARFCKAIHDSTELLSKVDLFENGSRLCECFEDPAEEIIENNEVVDLLSSQTIQDTHGVSKPKPTTPKQTTSLSGLLIRGGEHMLTTSNENPSNTSNDQPPSRPPPVESLQRSNPSIAPKPPKQASLSSARLNQSPHQSIRGEYLSTTSNENPSNSIDEQAPPRPPRVESLPHSNATGGDKDDGYHYYDEISSTGRNSNLALTVERYHMDNGSKRVPKREEDKLGQRKSSKGNSLPKLPLTLSCHLQCESNDGVASPQIPHRSRPLSEALSSLSSSDSQGFPAENMYIESVPAPSILSNCPSEFLIFPQDLKDLSVAGVVECLRNLHMGQYAEMFQRNLIDGQLLMELDRGSLSCLGVRNQFHQDKLLKFINGWRPRRHSVAHIGVPDSSS